MAPGKIRVGISGWCYEPWRGHFYPKGLVQHGELAYASRAFSTIEINGSFYSLQRPSVRHESFIDADFVRLLRQYGVALVVADTAGRWPEQDDVSADFLYLRLHGSKALYQSGYTDDELDHWAERIRAWRAGGQPDDARLMTAAAPLRRATRDIFCYFDNTDKLQAPLDARRLSARLGLTCRAPEAATSRSAGRRKAARWR